MAYDQAHDKLVEIVEDTPGLVSDGGLAAKFEHMNEGNALADSRVFFIAIESMAAKGENTRVLPLKSRYGLDLVVIYRLQQDLTALYRIIAKDHTALVKQLRDTNPDSANSTIECLWLGSALIGEADVEIIEGAIAVHNRITLEFRET